MRFLIALIAFLSLALAPMAPSFASMSKAGSCEMDVHSHQAPDRTAPQHDCCASAMPALPDRARELAAVGLEAAPTPSSIESTFALTSRPFVLLRPPRSL